MSRRHAKKKLPKPLKSTQDTVPGSAVATADSAESGLSGQDTQEPLFTYLDDGRERPSAMRFTEAYGRMMQLAVERVKLYGQLLAKEYGEKGAKAFWDEIWASSGDGPAYKTGEYVRALVKLENDERDRAARLLESALRFGIEARHADLHRDQVRTLVLSMKNLAAELGLPDNAETRRVMQRAVLEARKTVLADART